jgi:hypothetical protein
VMMLTGYSRYLANLQHWLQLHATNQTGQRCVGLVLHLLESFTGAHESYCFAWLGCEDVVSHLSDIPWYFLKERSEVLNPAGEATLDDDLPFTTDRAKDCMYHRHVSIVSHRPPNQLARRPTRCFCDNVNAHFYKEAVGGYQ